MVEERNKLIFTNFKIWNGELIADIPSKWTEFSSLNNNSVEEAKSPDKLFENLRLSIIKVFLIKRFY